MRPKAVGERSEFGSAPDLDTLFSMLSDERRRYALYCLDEHRNPVALADLADEVARLEHDARTVAEVPAEDVKSVYMSLYHNHVPRLEDAGIVSYSQSADTVRLTCDLDPFDLEDAV